MGTCAICGAILQQGADFCGGCGSPRALALAPASGSATDLGGGHPFAPPGSADATMPPHWETDLPAGLSQPPKSTAAARGIIAGLAALLLAGIGAGGYVLLQHRSADPLAATTTAPASGTVSASSAQETGASTGSLPPDPASTGTAGTAGTPPARRVIAMPDSARRCRVFDDSRLSTAYSGNDVTSCPFSEAVRAAYVRALGDMSYSDDLVGTRKIRAHSPVTKKDYLMTCTDTSPVVCRGGNNAVVYIATYQDAG